MKFRTQIFAGLGLRLPFQVVECHDGMARVRFDDASVDTPRLSALIAQRNRSKRAA